MSAAPLSVPPALLDHLDGEKHQKRDQRQIQQNPPHVEHVVHGETVKGRQQGEPAQHIGQEPREAVLGENPAAGQSDGAHQEDT